MNPLFVRPFAPFAPARARYGDSLVSLFVAANRLGAVPRTPHSTSRFLSSAAPACSPRTAHTAGRNYLKPRCRETVAFSYEEVAHFGDDDGVSERPLPLTGCASLSPEIADFRDDERRVASFEPRSRVVAPPSLLPLASSRGLPRCARSASLRAAEGRACVGSLRERSAPFESPPDVG